jgi:ribokinase
MKRSPRIATVGLASWDVLLAVNRYPDAGSYAVLDRVSSLPGGTTSNTAVALARLGAQVAFAGVVGQDEPGRLLRTALEAEGIDAAWLLDRAGEPTDACFIIVSESPADRTIYWQKGAKIVKGDPLDVPAIFGHDLVVLDFDDPPLLRFLTDLPAHTIPGTRLLGTLGYIPEFTDQDRFDVMLRFDALVGNEREYRELTGCDDLEAIVATIRDRMPGANLRMAAISRGSAGSTLFTRTERWDEPAYHVAVVDPTGAGDAFTAGIAWGMARRLPWSRAVQLGNALGALATRQLGAQASLPTWSEVAELTGIPDAGWQE